MIRETIIRKIVEIDVAGGSLLEEIVQASDELLYASAVNEFVSWETALQYAGVSTHDVGRCRDLSPVKWSKNWGLLQMRMPVESKVI